jgi:hypothetical protein
MEKMEGKTESLEMMNENYGCLIVIFEIISFYNIYFLVRDLMEKMEGKQSLWKW